MIHRTNYLAIVAIALLLASGGTAEAAFITPTNAWSTSYWPGYLPINMINSSGLSANSSGGTHNSNHTDMWAAGSQDGGLGGPTGAPPSVAAQEVVFDLGGTYDLTGTHIWNHNQSGGYLGRGTQDFDVYVSSDSDPNTATWTLNGSTRTLNQGGGTGAEPSQWKPFAASGVNLVKFDIQSAHSGATNEFVGLSEVRFEGGLTNPVSPADVIFSEDFESTGVADGAFAATDWPTTDFSPLSPVGGGNLLNPTGTGSAWLNPVPAELGEIFGVLHSGATATADLTDTFAPDTTYTLTFTHFRRDDLAGDEVTAKILTAGGLELASTDFAAIAPTDAYAIRELSYITSGVGLELGQAIRLQLIDSSGGGSIPQAGIDNITLTASSAAAVPEPSTFALAALAALGLLGLGWYGRRRH